MATAKLIIKNGKFIKNNGTYLDYMEDKKASINGWEVAVVDDKIICHAERHYHDGPHICHKEFKLQDGLLGLSGGYIDSRYAYFRKAEFQTFLDKYGLTAVKHEDPNTTYIERIAHYGGGECNTIITTDGKMKKLGCNFGRTEKWEDECPGTGAWEGDSEIEVTEATYVIVEEAQHEHDCHNYSKILYTLRDAMTLNILEKTKC